MTFEEYLAHEVNARVKHEIRDGILVAMAGGSPEHSDVAGNVLTELMNAYREGNPCRPSGSDQMVYLPGPDTGAYPDVSAVCGQREFREEVKHGDRVITNPTLVVEVLSKSTAAYDQTRKFERYLTIPSLREYVLIDPSVPWVRVFSQDGADWRMQTVTDPDGAVELRSVGVSLPMSRIYFGVETGEESAVAVPEPPDSPLVPFGS